MAPGLPPSEVDVFSGPHSRMKRLVELYLAKLNEVDVSSCSDLRALLWSLKSTFTEFKTHESIENECIMWRLKNRLQFLKVEISAVSEVHSDNKLSEMVQVVEDGCAKAERCQCPREATTIGSNVIKALNKFTQDFLPHMQEEEEIFQPLLMEYFSYSELKEIKSDVIEKHQKLTKYCPYEKEDKESEYDGDKDKRSGEADASDQDVEEEEDDDEEDDSLSKVQGLPSEVLLQVFSYLNPRQLSQCSMVCVRWAGLARDPSLWKHLYPSRWARGDWQFGASVSFPVSDDSEGNESDSDVYVVVDEDADFDESASSALESDASNASIASHRAECIRREARMLVAMARYLLPFVGDGVETVDLSKSKGVTNGLVYKLLMQCPNLQHLSLSETKVSDIAFKGLGRSGIGSKLRHLDLSGCNNITDLTLKKLASIRSKKEPHEASGHQSSHSSNNKNTAVHADDDDDDDDDDVNVCRKGSDKNGRPLRSRCASSRTVEETHCSHSHSNPSMVDNNGSRTVGSGSCHRSQRRPLLDQQRQRQSAPRTSGCEHGSCNRGSCRGNRRVSPREDQGADESLLERRLEFLSLSGCYQITDDGLRYLSVGGSWPQLSHLDLSGCLNLSGTGLSGMAEACPTLDHETFFYCDNIEEGPFSDTASGCQNLQCNKRVCCRSGE